MTQAKRNPAKEHSGNNRHGWMAAKGWTQKKETEPD
jgi:hypothetical protein